VYSQIEERLGLTTKLLMPSMTGFYLLTDSINQGCFEYSTFKYKYEYEYFTDEYEYEYGYNTHK